MPADASSPHRKTAEQLRSHRWFGPDDLRSFGHRSRIKQFGLSNEDYLGKPVIGILNTWSELNTCHSHLRERAENVKRGVWQAGGFPVEVPVMSLGEQMMKPTTMLYRNLLAMETEETLRCHPIDGAILLGGCDKTTPALLMGAISADFRRSSFPPDRCCRPAGEPKRSARAPMCGNIGPNVVPAICATMPGAKSKTPSPLRPALA